MKSSATQPTPVLIKNQTASDLPKRPNMDWVNQAMEIVLVLAITITPLLFSPLSKELFEFPKMIWVYALAITGLAFILFKIHIEKKILIPINALNRPIILYVLVFIISTTLSLNFYTSIMGYYSRFHGGLSSLVAYLILFYLALLYLQPITKRKQRIAKLVWSWLAGSIIVSIWAIAEHFGYSPSCWLLRGELNATCWVQDVQARVFATFGQPNWLAAYVITAIPLSLALLISSTRVTLKAVAWIGIVSGYGALWYSYSRSGWIGLAVAILILLPWAWRINYRKLWPWLVSAILACGLISMSSVQMASQRTSTALDSGNLDSSTGQIRLLVWQGSLLTAVDYPLFGSGPETFPYSFLRHRPESLNQTTEWNFLYNKAHNEVLQTLVTTGLIGLIVWLLLYSKLAQISWQQRLIAFHPAKLDLEQIVPASLFAGIAGVFTAQLLGFSVVATALYFWLAAAIFLSSSTTFNHLNITSAWQNFVRVATPILVVILILGLGSYVAAELLVTQAATSIRSNPWRAEQQIKLAAQLNPFESSYQQQHALANAYLAQLSTNPKNSEAYANLADESAQKAYQLNPHHILNLKGIVAVYQQLTSIDQKYVKTALDLSQKAIELDPADANAHQTLGHLYLQANQLPNALDSFNTLIKLRPQSANSYMQRAKYYQQTNQLNLARQDLQLAQKLEPSNPEIDDNLEQLEMQQPSLTN